MIPIRDNIPSHSKPYVTWALMAINTLIFLVTLILPEASIRNIMFLYGMVSYRYSHPEWAYETGFPDDAYLSFLTNMFLHGGWFHLIMNMIFMWIFADNIEDRFGHGRFLIFYLFCGILASISQFYFMPELVVPVVGASGAIAGVMGAYFMLYPYARIVLWVPFFIPIFFEIPAIAFLGLWVIIQLHEATTSIVAEPSFINVAWWAHIGGFIAGVMMVILYQLFSPGENK